MPRKNVLLDNTYLSDLEAVSVSRHVHPLSAEIRRVAAKIRGAKLWISIVTIAEHYEGFGPDKALALSGRYSSQTMGEADALRCGLLQTRMKRSQRGRLGENDAWLAAQALRMDAAIVTRDNRFKDVPNLEVITYGSKERSRSLASR